MAHPLINSTINYLNKNKKTAAVVVGLGTIAVGVMYPPAAAAVVTNYVAGKLSLIIGSAYVNSVASVLVLGSAGAAAWAATKRLINLSYSALRGSEQIKKEKARAATSEFSADDSAEQRRPQPGHYGPVYRRAEAPVVASDEDELKASAGLTK